MIVRHPWPYTGLGKPANTSVLWAPEEACNQNQMVWDSVNEVATTQHNDLSRNFPITKTFLSTVKACDKPTTVMIEWLAILFGKSRFRFLTKIYELLRYSVVFDSSYRQMFEWYIQIGHDRLFPHPLQFIINKHILIRACKWEDVDKYVRNKGRGSCCRFRWCSWWWRWWCCWRCKYSCSLTTIELAGLRNHFRTRHSLRLSANKCF